MFIQENCTECGTCLAACRYTDLDAEQAVAQIRELKNGRPAAILKACITCMACNEYCPNGANPYDLILAGQEQHNVRMVPPEAVEMIETTLGGQPSEVVPGDPDKPALCLCTMERALPPNLPESSLFQGMTVARGGDFFSRVVYLHTGMESTVKRHAKKFIDSLAALACREVVFVHADCYVLAAHKAREYGITVPFIPVHIVAYLLATLKRRKAEITPLNIRAAWQRPCINRYTPEIEPLVDELFDLISVTRVDRAYDRKDALCCGLGLQPAAMEQKKALLEQNLTDCAAARARALVFLCPGCFTVLGKACETCGLDAIFLTDLCRMAINEIPYGSYPLPGP